MTHHYFERNPNPVKHKPKVWFTADLHFDHKNIVGAAVSNWDKGYRDFISLEEMNRVLEYGLLSTVNANDTLYILGDISFKNIGPFIQALYMKCKNLHLILGNHDRNKPHTYEQYFQTVSMAKEIKVEGQPIYLHHYACRVWNRSHHGAWHLYGHSHGSLEDKPWGKSMDVGVDAIYALKGQYRPISFDEIKEIMDKRDVKFEDHHGIRTHD